MTQTPLKLSFEEYLTYDDGTDNRTKSQNLLAKIKLFLQLSQAFL